MGTSEDHEWFAREILVHEGRLRSQLRRYFSARADLEDVLQESYARVLTVSRAERQKMKSPVAFLFTIARNVCLDLLRRKTVVSIDTLAELESLKVSDDRPGPYEELNSRQELDLLQQAIASLPERCREVMVLTKVQGKSLREVAATLAISESTVEKHIANGVRQCAEFLWSREPGLSTDTSPSPRVSRTEPR